MSPPFIINPSDLRLDLSGCLTFIINPSDLRLDLPGCPTFIINSNDLRLDLPGCLTFWSRSRSAVTVVAEAEIDGLRQQQQHNKEKCVTRDLGLVWCSGEFLLGLREVTETASPESVAFGRAERLRGEGGGYCSHDNNSAREERREAEVLAIIADVGIREKENRRGGVK
ncbi:hypothetical protein ElyMa_006123400 [Elysia marginata]|uniref:Uncharacterized protein n=1 Tax=Elysia marginata TaxID=1093978 RepID=A0AAV4GWR9_9GAST|nr:hypothetical protein ElyMa_006123400 [Elysia marginata]